MPAGNRQGSSSLTHERASPTTTSRPFKSPLSLPSRAAVKHGIVICAAKREKVSNGSARERSAVKFHGRPAAREHFPYLYAGSVR